MLYCSTRGGVRGRSFRDVLFSGFAPDGGMFMPETMPVLDGPTLRAWRSLSYSQLVVEVASLFIPAQLIPRTHLEALVAEALAGFSLAQVVRFARLKDGLVLLELFHGRTLAFKDLAMTCTLSFINYFLQRERRRATVVVATSGDTGGSAVQNARGVDGLDVIVVYPHGRITAVQEKHMTTCLEDNTHVFAAEGSSDDIDQAVRRLFADQELVRSNGLMSLNSVNISRVVVQLAHFIYAYLQLSGLEGAEGGDGAGELPGLEVVVPTGGAGNIAAGYMVQQMGVPVKLVAMVNSNDIVHRTVTAGDFSMASVTQTLAPAIDIQDPYNLERVFWLMLGRDGAAVKTMMEDFQQRQRHPLTEEHRTLLAQVFSSGTVSDAGILQTMRRCWQENGYVLCPHTAVAVWHHYNCPPTSGLRRCYIATASPAKFGEAVGKAGVTFDPPEQVLALERLAARCETLERSRDWCRDWEARLRERIVSVGAVRTGGGKFYR